MTDGGNPRYGSARADRGIPRFQGENAAADTALLKPFRAVAAAHDALLAQNASARVQRRASVRGLPVVRIPGARKRVSRAGWRRTWRRRGSS